MATGELRPTPPVIRHRWTRHQYEGLIAHGFLDEDDPIELVDGLLLVKEPQPSPHRTAVLLVAKAMERAFGEGWFVQTQSPIILDDRSEPEPDVCVVHGSPRDYVDTHPTRPALVVEVAQSGLGLARGRKAAAIRVADLLP
jgi:Uma2 family endonuclease